MCACNRFGISDCIVLRVAALHFQESLIHLSEAIRRYEKLGLDKEAAHYQVNIR